MGISSVRLLNIYHNYIEKIKVKINDLMKYFRTLNLI